jgi:hypothetical protein
VTAVSGGGDTLEVPGVRALSGDVESARGDTLVLRIAALEPRSDQARGRRTTFVRAAGDQVTVRQPHLGRSLVVIVGILAAAMALYAAALGGALG